MIRATLPSDTPELLEIARGTGVFTSADVEALDEVLDDYHASPSDPDGHAAVTSEDRGRILGFAYYAPAAMTDRTWHLWWIVVDKQTQAKGVGGALLRHVEEAILAVNGRLLLIETSSLPTYALTRRFYEKHAYKQYAVLVDFYGDGHDMVIFSKRMQPKT